MSSPLFSVVIATYNAGPYLREAIRSVLDQTVEDLELIVVDDGSTDDTRALVASIQDPRLTYVWQENAGQTAAKNHGIRLAKGQFIGFCDGDDFWYLDKLASQLPLFENPTTGVAYSWIEVIDEHGKVSEPPRQPQVRGNVTEKLFMTNFVPFGTAVVRRACLEKVGSFDSSLRMGIDWDLWLRVSAHYEFDFVPRATYAYRVWSGQMSKNWRVRYTSAFRIMNKFMDQHPGLISAGLKRRAFADTYANRARARVHETPMGAIGDAARATVLDPATPYSWKTLGRMVRDAAVQPSPSNGKAAGENHRLLKNMLAPLAQRFTATRPRIFTYHRFSHSSGGRALGEAEFRKQMVLLKQHCEIRTLAELMDGAPPASKKPLAAITVDDGYADFYDVAAPVLMDLGLTATVFVTTGFIEGELHLWPDCVRAVLEQAEGKTCRLGGFWGDIEVQVRSPAEIDAAWSQLAEQLVFAAVDVRQRAIADLQTSLGVSLDGLDMSAFRPISWEQLRELQSAGFEIADHSFSHACLPTLSDDALNAELTKSCAVLTERLNRRPISFAYPNGMNKDYDPRIADVLKRLGYRCAVLSVPAPLDREKPYQIGRLPGETGLEHFQRLIEGFSLIRQ
jgi:glycosyltransferase involved in cell wall biosynthesis/peptidoglycan/xylan/chitin deacetylase (PgdA/CDA1 family)